MAWLSDGLSSLSSIKGQISNFTKEVLADGIVDEIGSHTKDLDEAKAKCDELQELLKSKETEISILRRQNTELQKAVVEFNSKTDETKSGGQEDDGDSFFWDPVSGKGKENKDNNQTNILQNQLEQAALKIKDLEDEIKKLNLSKLKEDSNIREEGSSNKTDVLRAKQDMMNRIIQMGEKSREVERNTKRLQQDELMLVNDFRTAISKLASPDQYDLIKSALLALGQENDRVNITMGNEKSDLHGFDSHGNSFNKRSISNQEIDFHKKITELETENKSLVSSIEELDKQHSESIEQILSLKEELQNKHQSLQQAYELLYVDYNNVNEKLEKLQKYQGNSDAKETEINYSNDAPLQTSKENKLVSVDLSDDYYFNKLSSKVKEIIKDIPLESTSLENMVETLANKVVELYFENKQLGSKFEEVNLELKETTDIRDTLQVDCDDMQTNIESLLLQIQHLKSNLPSIPEASEERVASLETETESLHQELRSLRRKNSELVSELSAIKSAIENQNINLDLSKVDNLLSEKCNSEESRDLNEVLYKHQEENSALRRRVEILESELRVSLERCKGLDENIELIEELKLDLENARKELKIAISNNKRLENSLSILQKAKNEVDADNEVLAREKDQLALDLAFLKESDLKKKDGEALAELRESLDKMKEEKNDLDYDIRNLRNELDKTIEELENYKTENQKIKSDYEQLSKENNKLMEQFVHSQKESVDKIELLNTEVTLLQQESENSKDELKSTLQKLRNIENRLNLTQKENIKLLEKQAAFTDLEIENQKLKNEINNLIKGAEEWDNIFKKLKVLQEKVLVLENDNQSLRNEVKVMEKLENDNIQLKQEIEKNQHEINAYKTRLDDINTEFNISKENNTHAEIIEKLRILENENSNLTEKLQKYLVEKRDIECDTSNFPTENKINFSDEQNKFTNELFEKSNEIETLNRVIETSKESALMSKEAVENLSQLISFKDSELENMKQTYEKLLNDKEETTKLVEIKNIECSNYQKEIQRLTTLLNEQTTNIQKLLAEKDNITANLQDKESELLWTKNELEVLRQRLQNIEETSNHGEYCGIAEHSVLNNKLSILEEKSKVLENTVIQDQSNIRYLQEKLQDTQSKEANLTKELDRLRSHLVEMEANFTEEALRSEEIQRNLEAKLAQAEDKLQNSSTLYTSVNIRANQQVETLQQQLNLIMQQRDDLQNKLSNAEDKIQSSTASLTNLQLVLEQFQRDKEKDIELATEKIRNQLQESMRKENILNNEISNLKDQLTEAKECIKAASRLTEQLEKKSDRIEQLNQEVAKLQDLVNTADEKIKQAEESGEGKVDKSLVKNLLLGYISSPTNDKNSVLRVIATVLDFNEIEREKSGLNSSTAKNSWFSTLLTSGNASDMKEQEATLSAAFVKFLESESQPKPQLPALPISNSSLTRPGHSRQHSSSSTQSTLLLSNVTLPTFPDFVPTRNTGSILKEVLKDS